MAFTREILGIMYEGIIIMLKHRRAIMPSHEFFATIIKLSGYLRRYFDNQPFPCRKACHRSLAGDTDKQVDRPEK